MNILLLRLAGPMQSWGVQSRFGVRETGLEPSKSGVIGLLCSALGRPRSQPLDDLAHLRLGVRADREGRLSRDYHTAQDVLKAGGGLKATDTSTRYYLADAIFLAGLECEDLSLLQRLLEALQRPVWPLYLGRKAFAPSPPIALQNSLLLGTSLENALSTYPYLGSSETPERLRLVLEDPDGEFVRPDQPVSFAERHFVPRHVRVTSIPAPLNRLEVL